MQTIDDPGDALAVLHDPDFVVPPVPAATHGIAWLRATVGRFSTGEAHTRRRALSESLLSTVDPQTLREAAASSPHAHPVQHLAAALGLGSSARTIDAVRAAAAAYQPGTGDETAADAAVRTLIATFGGAPDETTAARIGLLVQACDATITLIERARAAGLEPALRDTPPVAATKRMATRPTTLGNTRVEPGEVVRVSLHGIPFGAGPRTCPGRAHALALTEGALTATVDGGRPATGGDGRHVAVGPGVVGSGVAGTGTAGSGAGLAGSGAGLAGSGAGLAGSGSGVAGSGSGVAGFGVAGSGAAGSGAAGDSVAGSGVAGSGVAGSGGAR
ncbi:hypothetical protein OHA72_61645 [Dactylosporangium sp. NBC_01737]|uniref:hypothetical protein n=1 Tax=Dactylosporangium sp. NBC_01737 TaxID=2975959 RepID=UPI002E16422B|nr:hypothetical protein OHA72_61645 [Dactylosporangium sp. NBC_01737]